MKEKEMRKKKETKEREKTFVRLANRSVLEITEKINKLKKRPKNSLSLKSHDLGTNRPIAAILGSESTRTDRRT